MPFRDNLKCLSTLCRQRPAIIGQIIGANVVQLLNPGVFRVVTNWRTYLADHFGLAGHRDITYILNDGVRYHARTGTVDKDIMVEVWVSRYYAPPGFEIQGTDTVVDVGAQIGAFSLFAAKQAPRGRVYSFEPVPANFKMLQHNIEANDLTNVVPINKGIADSTASREICLRNTGMHSFYLNKGGEKTVVQVVSLAEFMKEHHLHRIDFMKIDCEGAEYEILAACPPSVTDLIGRIALEWHNIDGHRNVLWLKQFLEGRGFKTSFTIGPGNFLVSGYLYAARS
jgi:FkbM family methyltransferase